MLGYPDLIDQLHRDIEYANYTGKHAAVMHLIVHRSKKKEFIEHSHILDLLSKIKKPSFSVFHLQDNAFCLLYHCVNDLKKL